MTTIEGGTTQGLPEEPPAPVVHRLPGEAGELESVPFSNEKVFDFIGQVQEHPSYYTTHFELDLEKAGLLSGLEETGVLPPRKSRIESETSTSVEEQQPDSLEEERQKALKNLYIGTVLGHLFEELFPRK